MIPRFLNRLNQANGTVKSVNSSHGLESRRVRSNNSREGGEEGKDRQCEGKEPQSTCIHVRDMYLYNPLSCTINTDELQLKLKKEKFCTEDLQ